MNNSKSLLCLLFMIALVGCGEDSAHLDAPTETMTLETAGMELEESDLPDVTEADIATAHSMALVLDGHADIEFPDSPSRYALADGTSRVDPKLMVAGEMDAVVMSVAVSPRPRNAHGYADARAVADRKLEAVLALTSDPSNNAVLARTSQELLSAHENGQLAFILGLQNAIIFGGDLAAVDEFYAAGVRVFGFTHMGHNAFADSSRPLYIAEMGAHEPTAEHGGLSALGEAAVERLNELGGIIDISQVSTEAALAIMAKSRAPIIASHSNVQALTNVTRNLSDEELDKLKDNGGVIHVSPFKGYLFDSSDDELTESIRAVRREAGIEEDYLYPFELYWEINDPEQQRAFLEAMSALLGEGRIEDLLNHIDYVVERIGVEHVAIGTDFNHGSGIEGFQHAGEAMNITRGLMARGYSAEDIAAIWGGNFVRVWEAVEEIARDE